MVVTRYFYRDTTTSNLLEWYGEMTKEKYEYTVSIMQPHSTVNVCKELVLGSVEVVLHTFYSPTTDLLTRLFVLTGEEAEVEGFAHVILKGSRVDQL